MGQPISSSIRLQIVTVRREEKLSYQALATRFQVNYHTARNICISYAKRGESALVPDYSSCGRPISSTAEKVYRLVRLIYRLHLDWGVPYILTRIRIKYPNLPLQSERTYQRRIRKDCPRVEVPPPQLPREKLHHDVQDAHDEWQIDAKEQIRLDSGQDLSYLNITDAHTNALLKAKPFPPAGD